MEEPRGKMFSFVNRQMPTEPSGSYQTVGTLLRVYGWASLAIIALMLLGFVFMVLAFAFMDAAFRSMPGMGWWDDAFGAFWAMIVVMALIAFVVMLGVGLLWTAWLGNTYDLWRRRDPRAPGQVLGIAIVSVVLGALGVMGGGSGAMMADGTPNGLFDLSGSLPSIVMLGMGIALLVLGAKPEVKTAFEAEAPHGTPEVAPPPH